MNDNIKNFSEAIKTQIEKLSPRLRKLILILGTGVILFAIGLAVFLNQTTYEILFTELSQEEAQEIMTRFQEDGMVDYEYQNGTILVPEDQVAQLRVEMAMLGYPKSGFSYNTFTDNISIMSTDFENQSYSLFEKQDRIAANIKLFQGVKSAVVNIAVTEERKYVLDTTHEQLVTASVTVVMEDGGSPADDIVRGIQLLVASSVPDLTSDNVFVSDGNGKNLSHIEEDTTSAANQIKLELEKYMDETITAKVINVLAPIYGYNNLTVSVHSTVDIDKKIREIINYAPPVDGNDQGMYDTYFSAVELNRDGDAVGGVPGVENNAEIPTYGNIALDGTETYYSGQESIDYYVNQLKEQIQVDAGNMVDLTISVAINGEDLGNLAEENLVALVGNAAGIDANIQANKITVVAAPFWQPEEIEPEPEPEPVDNQWIIMATLGAVGFLIFMIFIMSIIKRRKQKKAAKLAAEDEDDEDDELSIPALDNSQLEEEYLKRMLDKQQNEVEERLLSLSTEASNELKNKVRAITDENPEIAAALIKSWLNGGDDEDEDEE